MKKNLMMRGLAVSFAVLVLATGCESTTVGPVPVVPPNPPIAEPIPYFGDMVLFDEVYTPLLVRVTASAASEEISLAETLKNVLNDSEVTCVAPGAFCDLQVSIDSAYQELTPAPQCRLSHLATISVTAADGTRLLPKRELKTENQQAYSTVSETKAKLRPHINNNLKVWGKEHFSREAGKVMAVSVLRFKTSKDLIEIRNPFADDVRTILDNLRSIKGVVKVTMTEADSRNRIASFRVLYRKDIMLKSLMKAQMKKKK